MGSSGSSSTQPDAGSVIVATAPMRPAGSGCTPWQPSANEPSSKRSAQPGSASGMPSLPMTWLTAKPAARSDRGGGGGVGVDSGEDTLRALHPAAARRFDRLGRVDAILVVRGDVGADRRAGLGQESSGEQHVTLAEVVAQPAAARTVRG